MKKRKRKSLSTSLIVFILCFIWCGASAALENSECLDCHGDEAMQRSGAGNDVAREQLFVDQERFDSSVHNLNGIACVDCHVNIVEIDYSADIPHAVNEEPRCTGCHEEEGAAFHHSAHGQARGKGITMRCYACHDYHYVTRHEALSVADRRNKMCFRCHNPYRSHEWLPQKNAHFDFVECTACHAPEAPHQIRLNFRDLITNRILTGDEILEILGISYEQFMPLLDRNDDRIIDEQEFADLALLLRQKKMRIVFQAEMVAQMHAEVHGVTSTGANRDCDQCHSPASPLFGKVNIALKKDDGTVIHHEVARSVLESYHTSHIYALAGTRIKLLDKIGLALMGGGVFVVLGHMMVRIATIPARRRKNQPK
jgi:predicted CXXCH cytochrome family protein